jgi:hypothetical protein
MEAQECQEMGDKTKHSGPVPATARQQVRPKPKQKQKNGEDPEGQANREFIRAENEDDDGYDPYSDRRPTPEPLFERDPWD